MPKDVTAINDLAARVHSLTPRQALEVAVGLLASVETGEKVGSEAAHLVRISRSICRMVGAQLDAQLDVGFPVVP